MSTIQEWNEYFHLFRWEGCTTEHPSGIHCDDYPLFETPAVEQLLKQRAQSYGSLASVSSYIRAFAALKAEGAIQQVRSKNPHQVEPEETLTAEQYSRMPASQIVIRYRSDPEFKAGVDHLIAIGAI